MFQQSMYVVSGTIFIRLASASWAYMYEIVHVPPVAVVAAGMRNCYHASIIDAVVHVATAAVTFPNVHYSAGAARILFAPVRAVMHD